MQRKRSMFGSDRSMFGSDRSKHTNIQTVWLQGGSQTVSDLRPVLVRRSKANHYRRVYYGNTAERSQIVLNDSIVSNRVTSLRTISNSSSFEFDAVLPEPMAHDRELIGIFRGNVRLKRYYPSKIAKTEVCHALCATEA